MPSRTYLTVNLLTAKSEDFNLSEEEINKLEKKLAAASPKNNPTGGYPVSLVALTDRNGKIAYTKRTYRVENNTRKGIDILVVEYPLFLDSQAQREWIKTASNHFKPLLSRDFEFVKKGQTFSKITKRPFWEQTLERFNPEDPENTREPTTYRSVSYSDKMPYGTKTTTSLFLQKRNQWIKTEYKKLRDKKTPEADAYPIIQEKLASLPQANFGKTIQPKSKKPFKLSADRIKAIVQSQKS